MDATDVIAALSNIRRMDEDLVGAYGDAVDKVQEKHLVEHFRRFGQEHQRHAADVEQLMWQEGWSPVEPAAEPSRLIAGLRGQVDAARSENGVLDAIRLAETAIAAEHAEALQMELDESCERVLLQDYQEDQEHLELIGRHLAGEAEPAWRRPNPRVRWGTGGHGTGDQFGGGEAGGAGGFPSAGPSYSGGEDDITTGE
jgi:hypothetical protein